MTEITKDMLDLRTKPTVKDGLVFDSINSPATGSGAMVRFVDYQPGNGTRYWFSIMNTDDFDNEVNKKLGFYESSGYLVTDLNHMKSMVLTREGFISYDFIMEKLGCGISDAYVLAELFGKLLGRDCEEAGP